MSNVTKTDIKIGNTIILKSVYGKVGMVYMIAPARNPKTGQFEDCVKHVDSNNDMILRDDERNSGKVYIKESEVFKIVDGTTFNLNDPYDKAKWDAIKYCPLIAPNRYATDDSGNSLIDGTAGFGSTRGRYGIAELFVFNPGEETVRKVSRRKLQHKAISFILDDPRGTEGRALMARLLGKNMNNQPDSDVENYLMEIAEKDPERIINLYTGDDLALRILFMEARDKGKIVLKNKLFMYGDNIQLGATDDAVIAWMQDNRNAQILEMIRKDTFPDYVKKTGKASKPEEN